MMVWVWAHVAHALRNCVKCHHCNMRRLVRFGMCFDGSGARVIRDHALHHRGCCCHCMLTAQGCCQQGGVRDPAAQMHLV